MKPTSAGAGSWRATANIPETFQARGVAVHFTTPELSGARVRSGPRATIELAINSLAGGRGIYVLPWESAFAFSTPTIHDRVLVAAIKGLAGLTPAAVRSCALAVAVDGFAGPAAAVAAVHARDADRVARTLTNYHLLLAALRRHEPHATDLPEPGEVCSAAVMSALRPRFRSAAAAIAGPLRLPTEVVVNALEEIAGEFASIGVQDFCRQARVPGAVAAIRALRRDLARCIDGSAADGVRQIAFIAAAAGRTVAAADAALSVSTGLSTAAPKMIQQWLHDRQRISAVVARSGWLIDGWERICLLWQLIGNDTGRLAALNEMAALVPVLPVEAVGWPGVTPETVPEPGLRHNIAGQVELHSAACGQDAIARNEHIRALAA